MNQRTAKIIEGYADLKEQNPDTLKEGFVRLSRARQSLARVGMQDFIDQEVKRRGTAAAGKVIHAHKEQERKRFQKKLRKAQA